MDKPLLRRTRFVCVSDTHNSSPLNGSFKLPKGDVLIHAGDLTNQGTLTELDKSLSWIETAEFEVKIVTAGNHDLTLDAEFYAQHGPHFHNQYLQNSVDCINRIKNSPSITYLEHECREIKLTAHSGPRTTFKVFGSPYSPSRGLWAFGYKPDLAAELWRRIPLDTDILITHTPPKYHCDESRDRGAAGCEDLRQMLWRVRPKLHVCGHVHEGRGVERVMWNLNHPNIRYMEEDTSYWINETPPKGQCLVDLSARGGEPLDNDGGREVEPEPEPVVLDRRISRKLTKVLSKKTSTWTTWTTMRSKGSWKSSTKKSYGTGKHPSYLQDIKTQSFASLISATNGLAVSVNMPLRKSLDSHLLATRGRGGYPSGRSDLEALKGRLGRKETCVVNAAITASSWPHRGSDGIKRYNKPIVVDIDLPVWEEPAEEDENEYFALT